MDDHRNSALGELAAELRKLRAASGGPTQQCLAERISMSRSMISEFLGGKRLPSWEQTKSLLEAMAPGVIGRPERLGSWRALWQRAHDEQDARKYSWHPFADEPPISPLPEAPLLDQTTSGPITATWYRDNPEFYGAAAESVRRAQRDIRTTYIRRYPPSTFTSPASAAYFAAILDWARESGETQRSARRVFGVTTRSGVPEPKMLEWLHGHRLATADLLNYEAGVFEWGADADGVNMCLLDDDSAFLAFSGASRQQLNGFSVADRTFVDYFVRYFEQLWAASEPLELYLDRKA